MQTVCRRQSLARIFSPKTPPLVPPSFPPTPPLFDCLPTHLVRPPAPVRGPSVRRRPLRRPNRRSLLLPSVLKPSRPGYTARRAASRPGCRLAGGTFRPPLTELQLWLWIPFPLGMQTLCTRHPKWKKVAFHLASSTQIRVKYATTTTAKLVIVLMMTMTIIEMKGRKRRP